MKAENFNKANQAEDKASQENYKVKEDLYGNQRTWFEDDYGNKFPEVGWESEYGGEKRKIIEVIDKDGDVYIKYLETYADENFEKIKTPEDASETIQEKADNASKKIENKVEEHKEVEDLASEGKFEEDEIDKEREKVVEKSKEDLKEKKKEEGSENQYSEMSFHELGDELEKVEEEKFEAFKKLDKNLYLKKSEQIKEIKRAQTERGIEEGIIIEDKEKLNEESPTNKEDLKEKKKEEGAENQYSEMSLEELDEQWKKTRQEIDQAEKEKDEKAVLEGEEKIKKIELAKENLDVKDKEEKEPEKEVELNKYEKMSHDDLSQEWEKAKEALYKADKEKDEESYNENYEKIKKIELYKNLSGLEDERSQIRQEIDQAEKEKDEKAVLEAEEKIREVEKNIDLAKEEINEKVYEQEKEEVEEEERDVEESAEDEVSKFEKEIVNTFAEFNISEKDLESIEGFKDLNTGAQFLIAKNLKSMSLEEVRSEVKEKQESAYKNKNILSKIGTGISNIFKKSAQEKIAMEKQKSKDFEDIKVKLENLSSLYKSMEIKGEIVDGKQFFEFADKENASPEKQEVYNQFNKAANLWSEIPEYYKEKYANKDQKKQYKEALDNYQKLKEELLRGEDEKKAQEVNNIDLQISILKTMNADPDLEKDWNNMGKSGLKKFFSSFDKAGYLAAGYGARTLTASLVGLAAVPLTAAGLGAWRGLEKGKKKLRESDKEKSKKESTTKVHEKSIDRKTELSKNLGNKIEKLVNDYKKEEDEKRKVEILNSINNRLNFTKDKLGKDLVNFGSSQDKANNLLEFYQKLSQAEVLCISEKENVSQEDLDDLVYKSGDKEINVNERVEKALKTYEEITEKKLSKNRKKFIFKQVRNGALLSGAFALAGIGIREGVEAFKEAGDEVVEEVSEGVSETIPDSGVDTPEAPIKDEIVDSDSGLSESIKQEVLSRSEIFNELRQSGELSKVISNEDLDSGQTDSIWRSAREIFLRNPEELGFEGDVNNTEEIRAWADNQVGNAINRMDDLTDKVHEGNIVSLELDKSNEYVINVYQGDGAEPGYLAKDVEFDVDNIKPAPNEMESINSSGLETNKPEIDKENLGTKSKPEDLGGVEDKVESSMDDQEKEVFKESDTLRDDVENISEEDTLESDNVDELTEKIGEDQEISDTEESLSEDLESTPEEPKETELTPEEKGEKLGRIAAESYFNEVTAMRRSDEIFSYLVRNQNMIPDDALEDLENTFVIGARETVFGRVRGGTETSLANELNKIVGDENFYQNLNESKQEEFKSIFNRLVNGPANSRNISKRRLINLIRSIEK